MAILKKELLLLLFILLVGVLKASQVSGDPQPNYRMEPDEVSEQIQAFLESIRNTTVFHMRLNIYAQELLSGWEGEVVKLDPQIKILVALHSEINSLYDLLVQEAPGQVRDRAFDWRHSNLGNIGDALSALRLAKETAEISKNTQTEISQALLKWLDEESNGSWFEKLSRIQGQIESVSRCQAKVVYSFEQSYPYHSTFESLDEEKSICKSLKKEKSALKLVDPNLLMWVGAKLKWSTLEALGVRTEDVKKSFNIGKFPRWQSQTFEEPIWAVPQLLDRIYLTLTNDSGYEPAGKYTIDASIRGMEGFLDFNKSQRNSMIIYLWDSIEKWDRIDIYAIAGRTLYGTIKCNNPPPSGPERLKLNIQLDFEGEGKLTSAKPPPHLMEEFNAGNYLIDYANFLDKIRNDRLAILEHSILEASTDILSKQITTVDDIYKLKVKVTNIGSSDIENLWLGVDILDPTNHIVETTRTHRPSSETPDTLGYIFFGDQQGQTLRSGRSWTFNTDYRFELSSTGHRYVPGVYSLKYRAWMHQPGDGLILTDPKQVSLILKSREDTIAFQEKPDIQIVGFMQEPFPVELDKDVELIFTIENQSDIHLEFGILKWWIYNENWELMNKFERIAVTMQPRESKQFSEPILLRSKDKGGKFTAGIYTVLFSALMPSDTPNAEIVVGNQSNLTFQVLMSREQVAKNIREWIEVIEEDEKKALPRIRREEQLRADERRREEQLEQEIADYYRKLNEEEDAKVRRELEEARDRLTQALLAMVSEHQQRRTITDAKTPQAVQPSPGRMPHTPQSSAPGAKASNGPLTVKLWTIPRRLSISEFWRTGGINVTLFYAVGKDCDVEISSELKSGCFGSFTGAQLVETVRGEGGSWVSAYSSPGGGGVRWSHHPSTCIVARHIDGGRTYTHDLMNIVLPPAVDQYVRSGLSEPQTRPVRLQVDCSTTLTIKATDGRRTVSDSLTFRVVP